MFESFPQQLKANFTPEQQDYYLQLQREEQEILNGRTVQDLVAKNETQILEKLVVIRQEMLNFVLTKKTREMMKQDEVGRLEREKRSISLDEIERKQKAGEELTDNELKFLYRIDGWGFKISKSQSLRLQVDQIVKQRNIVRDVAYLLNCDESQISSSQVKCLNNKNIQYHYGDLDIRYVISPGGLNLPQRISGDLILRRLRTIEGLKLPQSIGGDLDLSSLVSARDLIFPREIGGRLHLDSLTSAEGLILPQYIGVYLVLFNLSSSKGLEIPMGVKIIFLKEMPDSEIEKLRKKFPHVAFEKV